MRQRIYLVARDLAAPWCQEGVLDAGRARALEQGEMVCVSRWIEADGAEYGVLRSGYAVPVEALGTGDMLKAPEIEM